MPNHRRSRLAGGTYFFTVVTHRRRPTLTSPPGLAALRHALRRVRPARPFDLVAICVLPDHLHAIWSLPDGDFDYSGRWAAIKSVYTRRFQDLGCAPGLGRRSGGRSPLWQKRYWEHTIRDDEDLRRHVDYIHYNPVKHGYVARPGDWRWSSFGRYVRRGWYDPRWGETEPAGLEPEHGMGE